jgi:hypothetical protein
VAEPTFTKCRLTGVAPDGTLTLVVDGEERPAELAGVDLPEPPPAEYFELLDRALHTSLPLQCRFVGEGERRRQRVRLQVFGWKDKSGDVWLDLSQRLVDQGIARPEPTP